MWNFLVQLFIRNKCTYFNPYIAYRLNSIEKIKTVKLPIILHQMMISFLNLNITSKVFVTFWKNFLKLQFIYREFIAKIFWICKWIASQESMMRSNTIMPAMHQILKLKIWKLIWLIKQLSDISFTWTIPKVIKIILSFDYKYRISFFLSKS